MLLETLAAPVAATGMFTLAWTMIAGLSETGELVVMVNGISLPGHAPIVIRSFTPQKVRIVR